MVESMEKEKLWNSFANALANLERGIVDVYNGNYPSSLTRDDAAMLLKSLRDARQDFMAAAAGQGDNSWIGKDEDVALKDAEFLAIIVAAHFSLTDKEIDAAKPAYKVLPRKTSDTLNWPPRFDR